MFLDIWPYDAYCAITWWFIGFSPFTKCRYDCTGPVMHVRKTRTFFQNMWTITWRNMRQKYVEIGRDYIFFVNLTWYVFDRIAVI